MESFEDVISGLINGRGLSKSAIARTVRVDRSRVSEWSRGLGFPSPQTLERLADAYGLDLDRLMRLCNYRVGQPRSSTDPDDLERFAIVRQVSAEDWPFAKRVLLGRAAANTSDDGTANHSKPRNNNRRGGQKPDLQSHDRWGIAAYASSLISLLWRARPVLAMPATATA